MSLDGEALRSRFGPASITTLQQASPSLCRCLQTETPVVQPDSLDMLQEVLRYAAGAKWRLWPAGNMEHSTHGGLPETVDLVVSMRRMARLVDYERGDLTMVVEAGVPLHAIAARAAEEGQRLAAEPWPGTAATIGAAVAANRASPARLRLGSLREALLGCRVVHADGTTTRSGGRVVKNVTGFDLPKLYVGSRGTLVILTELNLRLAPRPETSALVRLQVPWSRAPELLLQQRRRGAAALVAYCGGGLEELRAPHGSVQLLARFEGREAVVHQEAKACVEAWSGEALEPARSQAVWTALRQHEEPEAGCLVLSISSLPVAGIEVLKSLAPFLEAGGSALALYGVGTCSVRLPSSMSAADAAGLQDGLEERGTTLRWLHTEGAERAHLRESRPAAAALHGATKTLFDADGVFPAPPWHEGARP